MTKTKKCAKICKPSGHVLHGEFDGLENGEQRSQRVYFSAPHPQAAEGTKPIRVSRSGNVHQRRGGG